MIKFTFPPKIIFWALLVVISFRLIAWYQQDQTASDNHNKTAQTSEQSEENQRVEPIVIDKNHPVSDEEYQAWEDDYGKVWDQHGDLKPIYERALALAKRNRPEAQYYVAAANNVGMGIPRNRKQAEQWYLKSAEQGFVLAQNELARLYNSDYKKDLQKSIYWWEKAAQQNDKEAFKHLGLIYYSENSVKNDKLALKWLEKAANNGDKSVYYTVGKLYYDGKDIPQDKNKAKYWLQKAVQNGDKGAESLLKQLSES